jgi:hypothetical protein
MQKERLRQEQTFQSWQLQRKSVHRREKKVMINVSCPTFGRKNQKRKIMSAKRQK